MPDQRFSFALKASDHPGFDAMLGDLAACVVRQFGYTPPAIDDILGKLREWLARGGAGSPLDCEVRFFVEGGQLQIVVSPGGGREWRLSRALPD